MIDFELYRIFVIVAEEKNITKASEKLNISQPAITKHIKNLENQLSVKLFERKNKGVELTAYGKELYESLKNPIEELNKIDSKVGKIKSINIGTHNHMGSCIFGKCINQYYLKYPDCKLNLICEETSEMFRKLKNKELDIVFSKKSNDIDLTDIEYIKLGNLHDVIVTSKNSELANKELTIHDLENNIIYCPRHYAQAVHRIKNLMKGRNLNLNNSSYKTILELSALGRALGLVTREYVTKEEYIKYNLVELRTKINLGEIEFGVYLNNNNRFKELNNLIKIIKSEFRVYRKHTITKSYDKIKNMYFNYVD